MIDGGFVSNAAGGTITASTYQAIYIGGAAGTVVNAGYLSGGAARATAAEFTGGTVTNLASGTIAGTHSG